MQRLLTGCILTVFNDDRRRCMHDVLRVARSRLEMQTIQGLVLLSDHPAPFLRMAFATIALVAQGIAGNAYYLSVQLIFQGSDVSLLVAIYQHNTSNDLAVAVHLK